MSEEDVGLGEVVMRLLLFPKGMSHGSYRDRNQLDAVMMKNLN